MSNKKKSHKKAVAKKLNYHSYHKSKSSNSVITNIYTYSKRKPKRLGRTCIHFDVDRLSCKRTNLLCRDADNCTSYVTNLKEIQNTAIKKPKYDKRIVGVTTIILSDNRKCTNNNHSIDDINAVLRIASSSGNIETYKIPAAYCKECDTYFVLKRDYKIAKSYGTILCPIIDLTQKGMAKNKGRNLSSSESRIHQLGYNVQRGNGYTKKQRQIILANIIENTNISKHEIESCILRPMSQHKNQLNYSDAVSAWREDIEFVKNYSLGDIPEVIIDKVVIGKREK